MPLTTLQRDIARLIAVNRSASSHLAGAAAIHIGPLSPRTSNDLDYFHDEEKLVAEAFAADRKLLESSGYAVAVVLSQPGFIRAIVSRAEAGTKIEWAHDSAWRFMPPVMDTDLGYRLHPVDLSINKVLALAGRDEPRDFLDTIYVHREHLSLGGLCWAAVGKDPGYSPELLVELVARKGKYRPEDFESLQLSQKPDLIGLKSTWIAAIEEARALVKKLPAEDAGCLYLDPDTGKFVTPAGDLSRLVRHRGTQGGILPSVGETPPLATDSESRRLLADRLPGRGR